MAQGLAKDGKLDRLDFIFNPDNLDMELVDLMNRIDALPMGPKKIKMALISYMLSRNSQK